MTNTNIITDKFTIQHFIRLLPSDTASKRVERFWGLHFQRPFASRFEDVTDTLQTAGDYDLIMISSRITDLACESWAVDVGFGPDTSCQFTTWNLSKRGKYNLNHNICHACQSYRHVIDQCIGYDGKILQGNFIFGQNIFLYIEFAPTTFRFTTKTYLEVKLYIPKHWYDNSEVSFFNKNYFSYKKVGMNLPCAEVTGSWPTDLRCSMALPLVLWSCLHPTNMMGTSLQW